MTVSRPSLFGARRMTLMEPSETALFGAGRSAKRKARPPVVGGNRAFQQTTPA
jgi:hypothetical protein